MGPGSRTGPTFIGIGSSRCGTTWLHAALRRHPEVWLPPVKELGFFDRGAGRPIDRWRRHGPRFARAVRKSLRGGPAARADVRFYRRYLTSPRGGLGAYRRWFDEPDWRARGEITPGYCALPTERIAEIRGALPDLRVLFMMRDPIDRAWSAAIKSLVRDPGRPPGSLTRRDWERKFASRGFAQRSNYLEILGRWESQFPRERIFVGFLEDLEADPLDFIRRVSGFLGVDPPSVQRLPRDARNASGRSRIPREVELALAPRFLEMNRQLHERFGSHATRWYERTRQLCASASDRP